MLKMDKCIKEFETVIQAFMKLETAMFSKTYTDTYSNVYESANIMFRIRPLLSYEMTTAEIMYSVYYEFSYSNNNIPIYFNSCPSCKTFTKVYKEDYHWTENKILNDWKEIYQEWLDIKNETDKDLRFKKLTNFLEIHCIENDFN